MYDMFVEYRTLQVLGTFMNRIQQKVMVTSFITCAIWIHCLAINVLIKRPGGENDLIFMLVFSFLTLMAWAAVSVCIGGWAKFYIQSENIFVALKRNLYDVQSAAEGNATGKNRFINIARSVVGNRAKTSKYASELKNFSGVVLTLR